MDGKAAVAQREGLDSPGLDKILARHLIEEMGRVLLKLEPDGVARLERALGLKGDNGDNQDKLAVGSGHVDMLGRTHELGHLAGTLERALLALVGKQDLLGAHAGRDLLHVAAVPVEGKLSASLRGERHVHILGLDSKAVARAHQLGIEEVHLRHADESGDEDVRGMVEDLLRRGNLLDNAIKFTPAGGTIRFGVEKLGPEAEISIWNSGQGISPEALPYVFQRFYKEDRSRGLHARGAGLGLNICKVLVNLSGGQIRVESKQGEWCRFVFTLPVQPPNPGGMKRLPDESGRPGAVEDPASMKPVD